MTVNLPDILTIMLFGALLVASGFWVAYLVLPIQRQHQQVSSIEDLLRDAVHVTEHKPEQPEAEEEEPPSLPVDPSNPPFPRTYHRRDGRPVRRCHCHGRELEDGEIVLFWPNPDVEGSFWLVCKPEDVDA